MNIGLERRKKGVCIVVIDFLQRRKVPVTLLVHDFWTYVTCVLAFRVFMTLQCMKPL